MRKVDSLNQDKPDLITVSGALGSAFPAAATDDSSYGTREQSMTDQVECYTAFALE